MVSAGSDQQFVVVLGDLVGSVDEGGVRLVALQNRRSLLPE
jgi:hypothetical protein